MASQSGQAGPIWPLVGGGRRLLGVPQPLSAACVRCGQSEDSDGTGLSQLGQTTQRCPTSDRWSSSDDLCLSEGGQTPQRRWSARQQAGSARCAVATKSRSLGCLTPCRYPVALDLAAPPSAPLRTAQQRRAAFQHGSAAAVAGRASTAAARSERTPSVVVSDHSSETGVPPAPFPDGARRLSSCSSCSTVSSCGRGVSRRGSLVDLYAEGLVVGADGRLERDSRQLLRQRSLDPDWQSSSDPAAAQLRRQHPSWSQHSLDLDLSVGGVRPGAESGVGLLRPGRRSREDSEDSRRTLTVSSAAAAAAEASDVLRKVSDCSISSVSTLSQDDEDDLVSRDDLRTTDLPESAQLSQWRKLKGAVQWTPIVQTFRNQKYLWVQLAGHQGNFRSGEEGTIQKRLSGREQICLQQLMADPLRQHVPEYRGQVLTEEGETFLQLQDLLSEFHEPCVMDCKMGVRTYQEEELAKAKEKPKLRKDMYEKMMLVDPSAPTEEEHRWRAVTKPRYMVWRETISSTATLGFRIEGIRRSDGFSSKDFKTTRTCEQVGSAISLFIEGYPHAAAQYIASLERIRAALCQSTFFKTHELIGSSLLFVHDSRHASVWMIDFAKTTRLPSGVSVSHRGGWRPGNHEDGYLTGVDHLITILRQMAVA